MNKDFLKWYSYDGLDAESKAVLESIKNDENAIAERFAVPMNFGTAGLRSTMDVGISRMNVYTVGVTTQGLAELVLQANGAERGVAVCFDSRNNSQLFAHTAASVLAANGIKVYLFDGIRPTPELSFAILHYGCIAGINVTASHNPKEYNGYKVYWEDGAQLPPEHASIVSAKAAETDIFEGVKKTDLNAAIQSGMVQIIGKETDEAFLDAVLNCRLASEKCAEYGNKLGIVYTALHGTGYKLVPEALSRCGISNLVTIDSQMIPDGNFPTVASPNPENIECFDEAVKFVNSNNVDCSMILATDPDADRVGLAVRDENGQFVALNGNQIGALLAEHIISARKSKGILPANACAIKSIVSSNLFDAICEKEGVEHISVLTGFKYIGEKIKQWKADGSHTFIFGYEESQGYLSDGYARDKDAVGACVLLAEMACRHYAEGRTVYEALQDIYARYGFYTEKVVNIKITGIDPMKTMGEKMSDLRQKGISSFAGVDVIATRDFKSGIITRADGTTDETGLPSSDMLYYDLCDGSAVIIRPSGTEPKIKAYILTIGETKAESTEKATTFAKASEKLLIG